ncbi:hypothetical protein RJ55_08523 [Drechmeria coniospora]|nr:hypothetical protein RJ55_08523 [Drechmeria coniospora]
MLGVSRSLLIGYFLLFCQLLGLCHAEDYDGPTQLERLDHVPHDLLGKDDAHQMHMPDPMRNLNYHFVKIEGKPQGSVRAPTEAFVEELRRRKVDTVCFLDPVSSDEHRIIQFFESRGFKVQTEFRNEFNELINKEPSQKLHSNVKLSQFLEEGTYTGVLFYETKGNTKTATVFSRIWGYESVRLFDATGRAFWSQSIQRIRIRPLFLQLLFGITEKQAKEAVKAERIIVNSSSPYRPLWDHGRRNRFDAEGRTFVPRKSMVPEISLPPMSRGPVTAADAAVARLGGSLSTTHQEGHPSMSRLEGSLVRPMLARTRMAKINQTKDPRRRSGDPGMMLPMLRYCKLALLVKTPLSPETLRTGWRDKAARLIIDTMSQTPSPSSLPLNPNGMILGANLNTTTASATRLAIGERSRPNANYFAEGTAYIDAPEVGAVDKAELEAVLAKDINRTTARDID